MAEDDVNVNVKLGQIEIQLSQLLMQLSQVTTLLQGVAGQPGIVVRLDRLEQSEQRRTRLVWLAVGVAISSAAKVFL